VSCGGENVASNEDKAFSYIKNYDNESLKKYVLDGGNPNLVDKKGNSLLLLAVMNNDFRDFKLLLENGATPSFRNEHADPRERLVVMEQAAISENNEFLQVLLEKGADPNTLDSYLKYGVLLQAVMATKPRNVKLLISYGADINAVGPNGKTPIHSAIAIKNFEIANYLLDKGADLTIKDKWGNSPVDTLKMFGDAGIKMDSEHYEWYLKFLDKLAIDPNEIAKARHN
jgi:hypothetical protein